MPKLWDATVVSHRAAVRDAILRAAATLVAERGLRSVTMAEIATRAGIGRATLYKYFSDADSILRAWHTQEIEAHLADVIAISEMPGDPATRLRAVLERFALAAHAGRGGHDPEVVSSLHRDEPVAAARHRLRRLVAGLIAEVADAGTVRKDVSSDELAAFCLAALSAAGRVPSQPALRRLVRVTLDALRP